MDCVGVNLCAWEKSHPVQEVSPPQCYPKYDNDGDNHAHENYVVSCKWFFTPIETQDRAGVAVLKSHPGKGTQRLLTTTSASAVIRKHVPREPGAMPRCRSASVSGKFTRSK